MKRISLIFYFLLVSDLLLNAQFIYPVSEYKSELKDVELSNFDLNDSILYLPLGERGLYILNIKDYENIYERSVYTEYEVRSREKVYGKANCVNLIENKLYLSYGPLGLKILDVSDPAIPQVLGTYYRYQDVYCTEKFENYVLLGYEGMGLEIVDVSDLDDIQLVSRNNIRDFSVKNMQVIPPYIILSGGVRGLRIFKFGEPFTQFKQDEFPKEHLVDAEAHKILLRGSSGYLANDTHGLSVLNMMLPLYPHEVNQIKTQGKATDLLIDGNYLYVACEKYIEVYDLKNPEKPEKIYEYLDKKKDFQSLKFFNNYLFALYRAGRSEYGIVIFQVE